jgi:hypothetical protein
MTNEAHANLMKKICDTLKKHHEWEMLILAEFGEPAAKQASDKPRRMQGNGTQNFYHGSEHYENCVCDEAGCLPVEPVADKPRRMKANSRCINSHGTEHDWSPQCDIGIVCEPVDPIIPKAISGSSEPEYVLLSTLAEECGSEDAVRRWFFDSIRGRDIENQYRGTGEWAIPATHSRLTWNVDDALRHCRVKPDVANEFRLQHCTEYAKQAEAPDPGEGWRLLGESEKVRGGDEWLSSGGDWNPARNHLTNSGTQTTGFPYRRRIEPASVVPDPGKCYRWVMMGEKILSTDESKNVGAGFSLVSFSGVECKTSNYIRRRIEPPAPELEDVAIKRNDDGCMCYHLVFMHGHAVSEPGFIEYRYRHNGREWGSILPAEKSIDDETVFPHAWRRSKKGGA